MILVAKEDVLRGLKKFKRLAKQDLLASSLTSNPDFWSVQAEKRRSTYSWLMDLVEEHGVDHAYHCAIKQYAGLPILFGNPSLPEATGSKQALEMFFTIIGIAPSLYEKIPNSYKQAGEVVASAQS